MSNPLIDNIPQHLHSFLEELAARHRRSVVDEATVILTDGIKRERARKWPEPRRTKEPLTDDFIDQAKREGRE